MGRTTVCMVEKPYRNEEWLQKRYVDEYRSFSEIADMAGCSKPTLNNWLKKFDITRPQHNKNIPYQNEEWLKEKYIEERKTLDEVGDMVDVDEATIFKWLNYFEIDTRDRSEALKLSHSQRPACHFYRFSDGYISEHWATKVGDNILGVPIHRLLAVSEFGFDAVCDKDVHHRNGIPIDNRGENIKLVTKGEHNSIHKSENHEQHPTNISNPSHL